MNIFVLDRNPKLAAEMHCDKHVIKMILESAQMLSTAHRLNGDDVGYKIAHKNHPCTIWTRDSIENYMWLRTLAYWLNEQYRFRYSKDVNHKSWDLINSLPTPDFLPNNGGFVTDFALCMPEEYKCDDPILSYRDFYKHEKKDFLAYTNVPTPKWLTE